MDAVILIIVIGLAALAGAGLSHAFPRIGLAVGLAIVAATLYYAGVFFVLLSYLGVLGWLVWLCMVVPIALIVCFAGVNMVKIGWMEIHDEEETLG